MVYLISAFRVLYIVCCGGEVWLTQEREGQLGVVEVEVLEHVVLCCYVVWLSCVSYRGYSRAAQCSPGRSTPPPLGVVEVKVCVIDVV